MGRGRQFDEKAYFGFDDFRVFEVTSSPAPPASSGLEDWEIAVIVVAAVVAVLIISGAVYFVRKRKNVSKNKVKDIEDAEGVEDPEKADTSV